MQVLTTHALFGILGTLSFFSKVHLSPWDSVTTILTVVESSLVVLTTWLGLKMPLNIQNSEMTHVS